MLSADVFSKSSKLITQTKITLEAFELYIEQQAKTNHIAIYLRRQKFLQLWPSPVIGLTFNSGYHYCINSLSFYCLWSPILTGFHFILLHYDFLNFQDKLALGTSFFDGRGNRYIRVTKETLLQRCLLYCCGYTTLRVKPLNPACDQSVTFSYNLNTLSRTQVKWTIQLIQQTWQHK